ncbi:peroxide stress protein YaaA [Pelistega ratti]|uniref:peroxide stress protein YaaA n=1 Tax=Pelistega ratti TaxID=2652177 RepID=UPI00135B847C|nr:peroxide stress protein YaaA [Pelistega ratti]
MLFLLSPAKKLDYDKPLQVEKYTQPLFVDQAQQLITILKTKSVQDIEDLMRLSPSLAELNVMRYAEWVPHFSLDNARQALLAFNGDVYDKLDAHSLNTKQLDWAQEHIVILSGLYGALRPLDLMQAYRLEMGTKLENPQGKNLYDFWGTTIANYLNGRLEKDKQAIIINLASEEYFKSVDLNALKASVVQCVFQDYKNGTYKIISFNAKRARGMMARFAIEHQAKTPEDLLAFNVEGYAYDAAVSTENKFVFRRKLDD